MNDDPRRMWMYGITIEKRKMSLWYFSRSHSVKSDSFDFTEDVDTFTTILLSFLFATETEMGYDTTVHRVSFNKDICYVYELGDPQSPTYYRTIEPIHRPRILCVTGKGTRVWKAIQVAGIEGAGLEPIPGRDFVALKDVWLDEGAMSEKEIQTRIFDRLDNFSPDGKLDWAPEFLKSRIESAIQDKKYKNSFMEVETDRHGAVTKAPLPTSIADATILGPSTGKRKKPGGNVVKGSIQNTSSATHGNVRPNQNDVPNRAPRIHRPKQQYRLIYKHIGTTLYRSQSLPDTFRGVVDVYFALILLFLIDWVHRDLSPGNILLVYDPQDGRFIGKLSDLEYAKDTKNTETTKDGLKTGTPAFMPIEIHWGEIPILTVQSTDSTTTSRLEARGIDRNKLDPFAPPSKEAPQQLQQLDDPRSLPPKFRPHHDVESLWWIIVWLLVIRVAHEQDIEVEEKAFTHSPNPSPDRLKFFYRQVIKKSITHPRLGLVVDSVDDIHRQILRFYQSNQVTPEDYEQFYTEVWINMALLANDIQQIVDVEFWESESKPDSMVQNQTRSLTASDTDFVPESSSSSSSIDEAEKGKGKKPLRKRARRVL